LKMNRHDYNISTSPLWFHTYNNSLKHWRTSFWYQIYSCVVFVFKWIRPGALKCWWANFYRKDLEEKKNHNIVFFALSTLKDITHTRPIKLACYLSSLTYLGGKVVFIGETLTIHANWELQV
jgi:hypothetical protein